MLSSCIARRKKERLKKENKASAYFGHERKKKGEEQVSFVTRARRAGVGLGRKGKEKR